MENFLVNIKGLTVVDTVKVGEGFAILFDDGYVLTVTGVGDVTFTHGTGWSGFWDELKLMESES